ncbi:hypothetical protein E2C01_022376 [Portunus trituberculatus]|uniref:Uncharacterized protein n=1 Tax=Portunus trituberculatus TaxID=210409 RepID=A0A5B7E7I3_PORTR|nr:hypothetical protein [Portunus trituberculatus]
MLSSGPGDLFQAACGGGGGGGGQLTVTPWPQVPSATRATVSTGKGGAVAGVRQYTRLVRHTHAHWYTRVIAARISPHAATEEHTTVPARLLTHTACWPVGVLTPTPTPVSCYC